MEMEMLDAVDAPAETPADGVWNDNKDDKPTRAQLAWRRTAWAGAKLARFVPGFRWGGKRAWAVDGVLSDKVRAWAAEDRASSTGHALRRLARAVDADGDEVMDVVEDAGEGDDEDASEGDENDSEEIRALKVHPPFSYGLAARCHLGSPPPPSEPAAGIRAAISTGWQAPAHAPLPQPCAHTRAGTPAAAARAGYTVLVLDANLFSSVAALVTSLCWTVVVPLPAIMELDGLAAAPAPLGDAARAAVASVVAHVRSHADALKVQTSRGNYLASLTVRRELVDFDNPQPQGCSMDESSSWRASRTSAGPTAPRLETRPAEGAGVTLRWSKAARRESSECAHTWPQQRKAIINMPAATLLTRDRCWGPGPDLRTGSCTLQRLKKIGKRMVTSDEGKALTATPRGRSPGQ
ncbi:hypothetical protein BC834DRAFT_1019956 [Gloeopeniophorella convolvens]|nr:hypothetical protein BC834DRAFT_1019956 [Gloeopeniophorella convolvens]